MKTIKITEGLHKDIRKIQADLGLKTIYETIRFLETFYRVNKNYEKK